VKEERRGLVTVGERLAIVGELTPAIEARIADGEIHRGRARRQIRMLEESGHRSGSRGSGCSRSAARC
jgi:hypothetical protein